MQIHANEYWRIEKKKKNKIIYTQSYYSSLFVERKFNSFIVIIRFRSTTDNRQHNNDGKRKNKICLERAYLKIDMRHWVLSILANMWKAFHTKPTTMCSSEIDVCALLLFVVHCYSWDDDSFLMCWKYSKW